MSPTLNPALTLLASRADVVKARLRVVDDERLACAERHAMYVREGEELTAELDALEAAIGGLQAAEQSVALLDELRRVDVVHLEPTILRANPPIEVLCATLSPVDGGGVYLCSQELGHHGDHIALVGDRVTAQWHAGEFVPVPAAAVDGGEG